MATQSLESQLPPLQRSVARLEGAYEHVATKADVTSVQSEIKTLAARVQLLQWICGIGFTVIAGLLVHFLG